MKGREGRGGGTGILNFLIFLTKFKNCKLAHR
jgi:hypothetical protein